MEDYEEDYEDDYEIDCPKCGHSPTRYRACINIHCEDGQVDMYNDDPINHPEEGEDLYDCETCKGTGIEQWCPKCGIEIIIKEIDFNDEP